MQYSGKVTICGVDTGKLPKLTAQESENLLRRIKAGDKDAQEVFLYANLRLVLSVVQRFSGRSDTPDDLFQVGCIGLIKAVNNFDLGHNVKFSTYAVPMIIGEIRRFLRDNNCVRVSRSLRDLAYKAMQARETLAAQKQREVSNEEIAAFLEIPAAEVERALEAVSDPVSLFEPVFKDGSEQLSVMDQLSDEADNETRWSEHLALREALTKLEQREYNIIRMRYFLGRTQMEIAQEIGISQAQVSRLEKGALERMRKYM